jgi:hypothetical protein
MDRRHAHPGRRALSRVLARLPQTADRRRRGSRLYRTRRLRVPVLAAGGPADGACAPLDESLCFSTIGMTSAAAVMDDIVAALQAQGIEVEQYCPELGNGQQELSIRDGLRPEPYRRYPSSPVAALTEASPDGV